MFRQVYSPDFGEVYYFSKCTLSKLYQLNLALSDLEKMERSLFVEYISDFGMH